MRDFFNNDLLKGVIGSLIASGLIGLGFYLSNKFVPDETILSYKVSQHGTDKLYSWFFSLKNNSEIPIDFVRITAPTDDLVAADYSVKSPISSDINTWEGKISKGKEIHAMYVFSSEKLFREKLLKNMIVATYKDRNELTGDWEERNVEFHLGESSSRTFWKIFWFVFPFVTVSAISLLVVFFRKKISAQESHEELPGTEDSPRDNE